MNPQNEARWGAFIRAAGQPVAREADERVDAVAMDFRPGRTKVNRSELIDWIPSDKLNDLTRSGKLGDGRYEFMFNGRKHPGSYYAIAGKSGFMPIFPGEFSHARLVQDHENPQAGELHKSHGFKSWKIPAISLEALTFGQPVDHGGVVVQDARWNEEMTSLLEIVRRELNISVFRLSKPVDGATGLSVGEILAKGREHAIQKTGENSLTVHQLSNLKGEVEPGAMHTIAYSNGKGYVLDGALLDIDVQIDAKEFPELSSNHQVAFLRKRLMDNIGLNLHHMLAPLGPDGLTEASIEHALQLSLEKSETFGTALKDALAQTYREFGIDDPGRFEAKVSVVDLRTQLQEDEVLKAAIPDQTFADWGLVDEHVAIMDASAPRG